MREAAISAIAPRIRGSAARDASSPIARIAPVAARPSTRSAVLTELTKNGVKVLADDFSMKERAIAKLAVGITSGAIETVVDHLAAGHKTLWH